MLWTIEGADKQTGRERVLSVETDRREDAMDYALQQGLLVSDLHESILNSIPLEPPVIKKEPQPLPQASADPDPPPVEPEKEPELIPYPAVPRITPVYAGLKVGGTMLLCLAAFFYLAALVFACIFTWLAASYWPDLMNERLLYLGATIAAFLIAGLLHAASSACNALRDIARDLLRDVTRVVVASSGRDDSPNPSTVEGAGM